MTRTRNQHANRKQQFAGMSFGCACTSCRCNLEMQQLLQCSRSRGIIEISATPLSDCLRRAIAISGFVLPYGLLLLYTLDEFLLHHSLSGRCACVNASLRCTIKHNSRNQMTQNAIIYDTVRLQIPAAFRNRAAVSREARMPALRAIATTSSLGPK